MITRYDWGWFIGIVEGEGTIYARKPPKRGIQVGISQKDRWLLDRIVSICGGKVTTQGPNFQWYICGPRAAALAEKMLLYLSPRRQRQIKIALDKYRK